MRWERDQHGRPLKHSFGRKDKERNREYTWEVDDRLKKIVDSAYGPVEFEHDAFGNLSGATYNDFHKLWRAPDVLGNLFRTPERLDRKYGPSGQLMESTSTQGLTRYEYDAEGNLVKKTITPPHSPEPTMVLGSGTGLGSGPNADKIWLYEWNAAGHLSRLVRPDGQSVEFLYDPLGRRVAKTFAGRTTRWVWDGNLPLHEWQEETGIALDVEPPPAYEMDARLAEVLQLLRDKTLSPLSPQGPPPRPREQCPITWLFEPDSLRHWPPQGERRESIVCDHQHAVGHVQRRGRPDMVPRPRYLRPTTYGGRRAWPLPLPLPRPVRRRRDRPLLQPLPVLRSGGGRVY
ncbi:MAG: RHS repeat protein [Fibrobacteres bacterium]|nr:RHS repeat protein [Fibrobacterota bacterium]